jgi:hypothetical protein
MTSALRATVAGLPRVMKLGLSIVAVGLVVDIGYHAFSDAPGAGHGPIAFSGHLMTLIGMLVTMSGLLGVAFKRRPAETPLTSEGEIR